MKVTPLERTVRVALEHANEASLESNKEMKMRELLVISKTVLKG